MSTNTKLNTNTKLRLTHLRQQLVLDARSIKGVGQRQLSFVVRQSIQHILILISCPLILVYPFPTPNSSLD